MIYVLNITLKKMFADRNSEISGRSDFRRFSKSKIGTVGRYVNGVNNQCLLFVFCRVQ